MDDERLKRSGSILSEQATSRSSLQRVREIRLSERKFYQKITDIYATSVDYDVTAQATKRFFATVQKQAALGHPRAGPAAEVIVDRADATKQHMGLHTWTDAPLGKIQKFDVVVAKNYLTESELRAALAAGERLPRRGRGHGHPQAPHGPCRDWETRLKPLPRCGPIARCYRTPAR